MEVVLAHLDAPFKSYELKTEITFHPLTKTHFSHEEKAKIKKVF